MDKAQALQSFWSSFEVGTKPIPAFDESTVPEDKKDVYPRITYESATDSIGQTLLLNASLWDRNMSWVRSEEIKSDISDRLGEGGLNIPYTGGVLWIKRGTPFAQRMKDEDDSIRRIVINIEVEYIGG